MKSIICKNCSNDLWENRYGYDGFLYCTNCTFKRPYIQRKPRTDTITRSQERQMAAITRYFDGSRYSNDGQPTKKIELSTKKLVYGGKVAFKVETEGGVWTKRGGSFLIGRRGGLTILSSAMFGSDHEEDCKHLAKVLRGKVVK